MMRKALIGRCHRVSIWLVDGDLVRKSFYKDFIEGGHGYVYPWIPKNEVWIDDRLPVTKWKSVIAHELYERQLMKKGMGYSQAHKYANAFEREVQKLNMRGKL